MKKLIMILGVLILTGSHAWGESTEPMNTPAGQFGVFGTAGFGAYTMGNEFKYIYQLLAGEATPPLDGGISAGLGATYALSNYCQVGCEFEALGGTKQAMINPGHTATLALPALELGAFAKVLWPAETWWSYSAGLGIYGVWLANTTQNVTFGDGSTISPDFQGSTPAIKIWIGGEHFYSRNWSLGGEIGYRFASIIVKDQNGATWLHTNGSKLVKDFGGPFARITLQYYF